MCVHSLSIISFLEEAIYSLPGWYRLYTVLADSTQLVPAEAATQLGELVTTLGIQTVFFAHVELEQPASKTASEVILP